MSPGMILWWTEGGSSPAWVLVDDGDGEGCSAQRVRAVDVKVLPRPQQIIIL
jgi:hypothetical protein